MVAHVAPLRPSHDETESLGRGTAGPSRTIMAVAVLERREVDAAGIAGAVRTRDEYLATKAENIVVRDAMGAADDLVLGP